MNGNVSGAIGPSNLQNVSRTFVFFFFFMHVETNIYGESVSCRRQGVEIAEDFAAAAARDGLTLTPRNYIMRSMHSLFRLQIIGRDNELSALSTSSRRSLNVVNYASRPAENF